MNITDIRQYAYFSDLPVSTIFSMNGNQWRKRSTRTAQIVTPVEYSSSWFYFNQRDPVQVNAYDRLSLDYFLVDWTLNPYTPALAGSLGENTLLKLEK